MSADYAELKRMVRRAGLLEKQSRSYAPRIATCLVSASLVLWLAPLAASAGALWLIVDALLLALVFVQIAFVVHDAGHRQLFRSRRNNDVIGVLHANLLLGISYFWWIDKHDRHHSRPNDLEADPDVDIPLIAFSPEQARAKRGFARVVARHQAFLFYPLLAFEGLHLRIRTIVFLLTQRGPHRTAEALLVSVHLIGYAVLLLTMLGPGAALAFALIHHAAAGAYLGSVFAPNHKGMPLLGPESDVDFLRRQIITSRNVRGGPWVDALYGGLNYQIEHHLFPGMPSANLRRARPLIQRYCLEHGLPYHEVSAPAAVRETLSYLGGVGRTLAHPRPATMLGEQA